MVTDRPSLNEISTDCQQYKPVMHIAEARVEARYCLDEKRDGNA